MRSSCRLSLFTVAGLVACTFAAQARVQAVAADAAPAPLVIAQAAANDGVVSNPEFEKAGQLTAHAWLLLLDRKDWGTAWDTAGALFRQNVPLGTWMDNVPKLREPFGRFIERDDGVAIYKKNLGNRQGDYVTVLFKSRFANKPDVVETVSTVREPDGRWRVTGYGAQ
jgi:hypothetical protein